MGEKTFFQIKFLLLEVQATRIGGEGSDNWYSTALEMRRPKGLESSSLSPSARFKNTLFLAKRMAQRYRQASDSFNASEHS